MSDFYSQPPSKKSSTPPNLFRGGMMPLDSRELAGYTGLLVFDIRSLKIPAQEGRELEERVREFVFTELEKLTDLSDRTASDLSSSVFGIAID